MSDLSSAIGGAANWAVNSFGQGLIKDYEQDPAGDLSALRQQEYQKEGFQVGDIGKGAMSGLKIGAAIGGIGAPIGAAIGGIAGLGSALLKRGREANAEKDFLRKKQDRIQGMLFEQNNTRLSDAYQKNLQTDANNQIKSYYKNLNGGI